MSNSNSNDMQEIDPTTNEILYCCQQIFDNINSEFELEDLNVLFQDQIYIEMFKIMFPFLEINIQTIEQNQQADSGDRLQQLIELLSSDILTMDLSHIKGEAIASGDQKHLLNFLQIIFELSKLYQMRNKEEMGQGQEEEEEDINQERRHSVQGVDQEFKNEEYPNFGDGEGGEYDQNQEQNGEEQQQYDQNYQDYGTPEDQLQQQQYDQQQPMQNNFMQDQQEVQYDENGEAYEVDSKGYPQLTNEQQEQLMQQINEQGGLPDQDEDQDGEGGQIPDQFQQDIQQQQQNYVDDMQQQQQEEEDTEEEYPKTKSLPRQKSKKDLSQEQQQALTLQQQKQLMEQELFAQQQTQGRILKPNKKKGGKKKKKGTSKKSQQRNYYQEQQDQYLQQQQEQFDNMTEEQKEKFRQLEQDLLERGDIPLDDPQVMQYLQQLQQENQNGLPQGYVDLNDLNMNEIISEQIQNVKEGLSDMRNQHLQEDEQKTQDKLMKQKNEYKNFLKNYLQEYQMKESMKQRRQVAGQKNFQKKMVAIRAESFNLKKEYENEQKSLYYKLRDEKINYLRKIHRIIFELEKRKIIEEKNEYKENRRKRNEDTRNVLDSIENAYKDKIVMLKENLDTKRKERKIAQVAQREVFSKIERELRSEKKKQISQLRDVWRQEKSRFDSLMKDDVILEQKIMELYKKY